MFLHEKINVFVLLNAKPQKNPIQKKKGLNTDITEIESDSARYRSFN